MTKIGSTGTDIQANPAPRRLMIAVVCILCLGLLGSALFTFITLSRMRTQYLSNRGHEIAEALDVQARGPGKRNNPAFWQSLFDENYETYSGTVAFLALVDQNGNLLAGKGKSSRGPLETMAADDSDVYRFEELLGRSRNRQGVAHPSVTGWRIQIGLYSADADFIKRTAFMQLALSGLAILALLGLLYYLLRMLHRFVEVKARESAEAQLKSLGIMAASLAHEIRNPLGAIKGLTQLAQEEISPDNAAQTQLRTVVSEAERLEGLVSNLLDFARPKEPQISEFDVVDLLADVQNMLRSRLEASGVALQLEADSGPLRVRSDPAGLRQVLLNLLLNAIDASPHGSTVVLKPSCDKNKNYVNLQIDDAGPGLGGRSSDEYFQPFVTTKVRGTGLGLVISRRIIERLGGSIVLEDNAQGGARCSIRLPIS
jgi:signal transduction histidine kinase